MKKILLILVVFSCNHIQTYGQQGSSPDSLALRAMQKLNWLKGNWSGDGWVDSKGERMLFNQSQSVISKVKGTVLLIEGTGLNKSGANSTNESFSVISYDIHAHKYLMRTFKSDGRYVDANVEVKQDGTFIWSFQVAELSPVLRYTIKLIDKKWHEVGEFSINGTQWTKFYEMTLSKI
ncbi:MAG TPA: hypothetical protein PKJ62_03800 [Bacteroidia bacterium]|nr:hypothetical protein [Bacteroidia bacterium]HNS12788.1 hypothetical protein [Bacteroidia bacterium]